MLNFKNDIIKSNQLNRPFLRWAGGKQKILNQIIKYFPQGKRLVEPFVGGGAVFLNSNFESYLLSDINQDLINLYLTLQNEGENFIEFCREFFEIPQAKQIYYDIRTEFNQSNDIRKKSALFIYLNRHCYNGLCRYNLKGGFNVPIGKLKKIYFPEIEMRNFYQKTQNALIKCTHFFDLISEIKKGDIVYCDPPYHPIAEKRGFTQYFSHEFDEAQQIKLADFAREIVKQGAIVIISNNDTPFIQKIYKGAKIFSIEAPRYINCKPDARNTVKEVLAVFS